jgi:hypothetical protein
MKKKTIAYACSVFLCAAPAFAAAANRCSESTLDGVYLYSIQGFFEGNPYAEAGMEIYDGAGNIAVSYTDNLGDTQVAKGTYVINGDCQGSSTYEDGASYSSFIAPKGGSFVFNSKTQDSQVAGIERRVATAAAACSKKTLRGTYRYFVQGFKGGNPYSESGMESYNGAGKVVNYYSDGSDTVAKLTGTYVIDGNCQGTATYENGSSYRFYVGPKGDRFSFISLNSGEAISGDEQRISLSRIFK